MAKFLKLTYKNGYTRTANVGSIQLVDEFSTGGLEKAESVNPINLVPEIVRIKGYSTPDDWSPVELTKEQFITLVGSYGHSAKIPAIKMVRNILPGGLGLVEAKEIVEAIFALKED